jgi:serpin B
MKTRIITSITAMVMLFAGCSNNIEPTLEPGDIVLTEKSLKLVSADNNFTFMLFDKLPDSKGSNVMVSPLSISLALSMTLNGAEGETRSAMIKALGFEGITVEEINQIYLDLITALKKADSEVALNIANSIWIKKNYPVLSPFIADNQKYYDARVERLDFNQAAVNTINSWVNEKTNTKIPKILDEISAEEIMFLINAIYFKGTWETEFDASKTFNTDFTLSGSQNITVPMMKLKDKFAYADQTGYQAVKLPYGRGKFQMIVLLPDPDKNVDELAAQLDTEKWEALASSLNTPVEVDLWLPKFKFSWESELNDLLKSLGMGIAFSAGHADFSKINADDQLFITKVIHKSFIEVNEEGTEAAAATLVGIGKTSIGPEIPEFHATRPFLFYITEEDTGAILFAGKVENPLLSE